MVTTQPIAKKKEAVNLYLTSELVTWLEQEAIRLMTSKAAVARIAIERAAKELPPPEDVVLLSRYLNVTSAEIIAAAGYDVDTGTEDDTPAVSTVRAILGNKEYSERQLQALDKFFRSTLEIIEGMEG